MSELSCGEPQCSSVRSRKTANKEVKDKLFSAALCSSLSFLCGVYSRYLKKQKRAIQKDVKCYQIMTSPVANMLSSSIVANVQQQQSPTRLPRRKRKKAAQHCEAVYPRSIHQPLIELTRTWRVLFAIKYALPHLLCDHIICILLRPEVVTFLIGPRSHKRKWIVGR